MNDAVERERRQFVLTKWLTESPPSALKDVPHWLARQESVAAGKTAKIDSADQFQLLEQRLRDMARLRKLLEKSGHTGTVLKHLYTITLFMTRLYLTKGTKRSALNQGEVRFPQSLSGPMTDRKSIGDAAGASREAIDVASSKQWSEFQALRHAGTLSETKIRFLMHGVKREYIEALESALDTIPDASQRDDEELFAWSKVLNAMQESEIPISYVERIVKCLGGRRVGGLTSSLVKKFASPEKFDELLARVESFPVEACGIDDAIELAIDGLDYRKAKEIKDGLQRSINVPVRFADVCYLHDSPRKQHLFRELAPELPDDLLSKRFVQRLANEFFSDDPDAVESLVRETRALLPLHNAAVDKDPCLGLLCALHWGTTPDQLLPFRKAGVEGISNLAVLLAPLSISREAFKPITPEWIAEHPELIRDLHLTGRALYGAYALNTYGYNTDRLLRLWLSIDSDTAKAALLRMLEKVFTVGLNKYTYGENVRDNLVREDISTVIDDLGLIERLSATYGQSGIQAASNTDMFGNLATFLEHNDDLELLVSYGQVRPIDKRLGYKDMIDIFKKCRLFGITPSQLNSYADYTVSPPTITLSNFSLIVATEKRIGGLRPEVAQLLDRHNLFYVHRYSAECFENLLRREALHAQKTRGDFLAEDELSFLAKPVAIQCLPKDDWNGAFESAETVYDSLEDTHLVVPYELDTISTSIDRVVANEARFGTEAQAIIFSAHSNEKNMDFARFGNETRGMLSGTTAAHLQRLRQVSAQGVICVLDGCNTASPLVGSKNLAEKISQLLPEATVIGTTGTQSIRSFEKSDSGIIDVDFGRGESKKFKAGHLISEDV